MITSIVKYYIYKRRCNQSAIYFEGIKKEIKNYFITEKYIAKLDGKSTSLEEKWKECFGLFRGLSQIVPGARTASKNYYLSLIILLTVRAPGTICESPFNDDKIYYFLKHVYYYYYHYHYYGYDF